MSSLLWIFPSYRAAMERVRELEHRIVEISTKAEKHLADVEAWSARQVSDLEEQLARKPAVDMTALVQEMFNDLPYENGIPDTSWLTPGRPDVETR